MRDDLVDLRARLAESAREAEALPHRAKYLLLANGFLERSSISTSSSSTTSSALR